MTIPCRPGVHTARNRIWDDILLRWRERGRRERLLSRCSLLAAVALRRRHSIPSDTNTSKHSLIITGVAARLSVRVTGWLTCPLLCPDVPRLSCPRCGCVVSSSRERGNVRGKKPRAANNLPCVRESAKYHEFAEVWFYGARCAARRVDTPMTDLAPKRAEWRSDDFEIRTIREAISQDWRTLALNNLTGEQRKAVRDHLDMNICALRDLIQGAALRERRRK